MQAWKGTITDELVESEIYEEDVLVGYFLITNKSATTIGVNVYIREDGGQPISVMPKDLQLAVGESCRGFGLPVLNLDRIGVLVSGGTADYYFSIQNNSEINAFRT